MPDMGAVMKKEAIFMHGRLAGPDELGISHSKRRARVVARSKTRYAQDLTSRCISTFVNVKVGVRV
jgi:hypothetical protein